MSDETKFHAIASATLMHCFDQLEDAYERGELEELELEEGVLSIEAASGKKFVLSKHAPTRQIWLASPYSGGLHFSHHGGSWMDSAGSALYDILTRDLERAGAKVVL